MIHVTEIIEITDEVVDAFARLIPQLSTNSPPPDADALAAIARSDETVLFVAKDAKTGEILGSLTLAFFRIPTGLQARIEDVIVDGNARRRGIAKLLTEAAIDRARKSGAKRVGLTSRPAREAANALYLAMGFEVRHTNVYRYTL